jgi:excisionase family DNA binding protein
VTKPEVLTFKEALGFLRLSKPTLLKLLASGEVRGRRVGRDWRFLRSELESYLRGNDVSPAA